MANVFLKKSADKTGSDIKLDTTTYPLKEGTLYFTADQELYLDSSDKRQQIAGNIIYQDLDNAINPDTEGTPPTFGGHTVDEFLLKTDNIIPEIYISYIEVTVNGTESINIPSSITDLDNLMVYQNGLLLNENIHYIVDSGNRIITLLDYTAKAGEIFTFTGPTYANDNANSGSSNATGSMSILTGTLIVSNWNSNSYSLSLSGIKSNVTSQTIQISPYNTSLEEYAACEVKCISQSEDTLNFSCSSTPSNNLSIYIIIQDI